MVVVHINLHRISCDPLSTSKINIYTSLLRIGTPHEHPAFTQRARTGLGGYGSSQL